jgi:hypothetical protein
MKLFVLISDGGDGSYYPQYCTDQAVIDRLRQAFDADLMDYENGLGCDGDGFHYDTINVQDTWVQDNPQEHLITMKYANSFFEN